MSHYALVDADGYLITYGTTPATELAEGVEQLEIRPPQVGERWDPEARDWNDQPLEQPSPSAPAPVEPPPPAAAEGAPSTP